MKNVLSIAIVGMFMLIGETQIAAQSIINIPFDYPSIQEAIDQSITGDTLIVAPGIYEETLNFKGKDIVLSSQFLYAQDTSLIFETVIDANFKGPAVVFENGESSDAVLMGFTIRSGSSDSLYQYGGAVICKSASPKILNNFITESYSVTGEFGGGIVCTNSQATIQHNILDSNAALFHDYCGAIISYKSNLEVSDNTIKKMYGGYVFKAGGGIICIQSNINIHHNVIADNYYFDNVNGGVLLDSSSGIIVNNTFFRNAQGVTFLDSNSVSLINNIIWGSRWLDNIYDVDSSSRITCIYNDIEGGYPGNGNIDAYPDFVDTLARNLRLRSTSPCIDAGSVFWISDPDGTRPDLGAYYFDQSSTSAPNKFNIGKLRVYPNPAKDKFLVDLSKFSNGPHTFHVYNLQGEIVRLRRGISGRSLTIDRDNLPGGLYVIALLQNSKIVAVGKVIFE